MNPIVAAVAKVLSILTLVADIGIVLFLVTEIFAFVSAPLKKIRTKFLHSIAPSARPLAFLVALTATSGSLFYSEVAKFTPCLLCWYQRILMYPQTILIGMGIMKDDKNVADYAQGLSVVGIIIAAYHYYLQLGGNKLVPCSTVGYSVDCAQRFSLEFGYITIPMMSLTAFAAIYLLMHISKRFDKR